MTAYGYATLLKAGHLLAPWNEVCWDELRDAAQLYRAASPEPQG